VSLDRQRGRSIALAGPGRDSFAVHTIRSVGRDFKHHRISAICEGPVRSRAWNGRFKTNRLRWRYGYKDDQQHQQHI
jgi:hypothetical protein